MANGGGVVAVQQWRRRRGWRWGDGHGSRRLPEEDRWQPGDAGRAEEEWSGWSGGGGGDVAVIRLLGAVKERW